MNNNAIHKSQEVCDIIKSRCPRFCAFLYTFHDNELYYKGFQLVFPSAHSFDLNSIELAYLLLNKQKLQYIDLEEGEETFIYCQLHEEVLSISAEHCRYVVHEDCSQSLSCLCLSIYQIVFQETMLLWCCYSEARRKSHSIMQKIYIDTFSHSQFQQLYIIIEKHED